VPAPADRASEPTGGVVRRLGRGERDRLLGHLLRLDAEDRRLRFGGHASDERVRAYCARLDWSRSVVLGCLVAGEPRGVGELKPVEGAWPPMAELAVSVEAPFRGRGIGTELCRRLVVRARNRFVARVHMLCLLDNRRVQRIARGLGGALTFHPGEAEAEIGLPWPDPASASEEWLDEAGALLGLGSLPYAGPAPCRPPPSRDVEITR
jgi:GNAT superfamily N-acetyltransferase